MKHKKSVPVKKSQKVWFYAGSALVALIVIVVIFTNQAPSSPSTTAQRPSSNSAVTASTAGEDVTIKKSDITSIATFIPYSVGTTKMELIAVKATDGSIRTAFNTCQVCNNSGRGYYVQEGNELVCQNCGNRFNVDQVEVIKGGCNPVPILKDNKTETGKTITIPAAFISENASLFTTWKS